MRDAFLCDFLFCNERFRGTVEEKNVVPPVVSGSGWARPKNTTEGQIPVGLLLCCLLGVTALRGLRIVDALCHATFFQQAVMAWCCTLTCCSERNSGSECILQLYVSSVCLMDGDS